MPESEIMLTRQEFYDTIWRTPAYRLCKAWNITSATFANICDTFGIPRPTPDYWPLLRLNRPFERTPLTPATSEMPVLINLSSAARKKRLPRPKTETQKIVPPHAVINTKNPSSDAESQSPIRVAPDFKNAHPQIRASKALLEAHAPDQYGRIRSWKREKCVNISVTRSQLRRCLLIMDAILRELARRGHKPDFEEIREEYEFGIRVGNELVKIKMTESTVRRERPLSAEEKTKNYIWDRYIFEPTGILTFCIDEYYGPKPRSWSDTERVKVEDHLAGIVDAIIVTREMLRVRQIARLEEERVAADQRQRELELRQIWEKERNRREDLLKQSELWDKADRLRTFLASCEAKLANRNELGTDSSVSRWLNWARRYADEIDPLNGEYLIKSIHAHPEEPVKVLNPSPDQV